MTIKWSLLYGGGRYQCKGRDSNLPPRSLPAIWPQSGRLSQNAKTCAYISFAAYSTRGWDERRSQIWCLWAEEWASWVFIRGCPWTTLQGHKKLIKMEPIKNYTFQLGVWDSHCPEMLRLNTSMHNRKNKHPLWCCKVDVYIKYYTFAITLITVSNKSPTWEEWGCLTKKATARSWRRIWRRGEPKPGEEDGLSYNQH